MSAAADTEFEPSLQPGAKPAAAGTADVDLARLAADLDDIRQDVLANEGPEDFAHLRKLERWGRAATLLGYATAWLAPNPVSAAALSLGSFARWTLVAHPVSHRGYDRIAGVPERYTSRGFARGWRRFVDWLDWIEPAAWHEEHDLMHHFHLGDPGDPDRVKANTWWLRDSRIPRPARYVMLVLLAAFWKFLYYAPNTHIEKRYVEARRRGERLPPKRVFSLSTFSLLRDEGRALWRDCYLPYGLIRFVLLPALFLPLGTWAAACVLLNTLLAEILTNLHGFAVIVPNHTGTDIPAYQAAPIGRGEFYLRQIEGSANYRGGSDAVDFLQGWLNYQIEHHLWPDLSLLQYQRIQPRVRELCLAYGIPYKQESVWRRLAKSVDDIVERKH